MTSSINIFTKSKGHSVSILFTSLSHNSRYWNDKKLKQLFTVLDKTIGYKYIAIDNNHLRAHEWIDRYSHMFPLHTAVSFISCKNKYINEYYENKLALFICEEFKKEGKIINIGNILEVIRNRDDVCYPSPLYSSIQNTIKHHCESYIISREMITQYFPSHLIYNGIMNDSYASLFYGDEYKRTNGFEQSLKDVSRHY
jgi:hypothetical protein